MRYLLAFTIAAVAYALRSALQPVFGMDRCVYPFFYLAAVLIAFLVGARQAMLASLVMGALAYWRFAGPAYSFEMKAVPLVSSAIYALTVAANIWLIHVFKQLLAENRSGRKQAEETAEGHAALFREFNERAATYFQLISTFMSTHSSARDQASYEKALAEISRHTMQISKLHRSLESAHQPNTDIAAFVRHMLTNAIEMAGASKIRIIMSGDSMMMPADEATSVAVVMMEISRALIDCKPHSIMLDVEQERGPRLLRLTAYADGEQLSMSGLDTLKGQFVSSTVSQLGARLRCRNVGQNIVAELELPGVDQIYLAEELIDMSRVRLATRH